jgi:hypothetical protein
MRKEYQKRFVYYAPQWMKRLKIIRDKFDHHVQKEKWFPDTAKVLTTDELQNIFDDYRTDEDKIRSDIAAQILT